MAVQIPFAGLVFMRRLGTIGLSSQMHVSSRRTLVKLYKCMREIRDFSAGAVKYNETEGDKPDSSPPGIGLSSRKELSRRRRPLSPLERISSLLPQDALSPEVMQLRDQSQQDPTEVIQVSATHCTPDLHPVQEELASHLASDAPLETNPSGPDEAAGWPTLPGESLLAFGDLLVAEYLKKQRVEFRKMFQLQSGARLQSSWGILQHDHIVGQPAGRFMKTGRGVPILIRRASLEDYVLFMKRGPAISYPKDAAIMLQLMDVTEGDCVLESGSGSGAMSLFLSRAVGSKGSVLSVEVREDHYRRAVLNYDRWRTAWSLRRGKEWPDNVHFHNTDLCTASTLLADQGFHAAALDLINPHLVLPTVTPRLHPGAVCAVYLANITQVIDLLEGLRCLALPLLCERIIEVPARDWLVAPALQKDGSYCVRRAPMLHEHRGGEEDKTLDESYREEKTTQTPPAFASIPYIARPHPEQMSHTAFLVKLRKCIR